MSISLKTFLAAAIGTALIATSAKAADIGPHYTKAPVAAPLWSWTGFYVGGHVGGGFSEANVSAFAPAWPSDPGNFSTNGNGVVGGGQIGFNWQFGPNWVIGIEGDISGTGIRNNATVPVTVLGNPVPQVNHEADRNIDWMASVRGRLGWTWDRLMIYGTGGAAWADVYYRTNFGGPALPINASVSKNATLSGWVAGGGVEYAVSNNWTVRGEYLYYDFGSETVLNPTIIPGFTYTTNFDNKIHVVRGGVNYKF